MPEKTTKQFIVELVEKQDELVKKQEARNKDIVEIKACLLGDDYHPGGGLVAKVNNNKDCIRAIKKKQNKFFAYIGGAWTTLTIGITLLISYFSKG